MPYILAALVLLAVGWIQLMIGGTVMLYSLPGYCLAAAAGLASIAAVRRPIKPIRLTCVLLTMLLAGYVVWRATTSPVEYLARRDLYLVLGALIVYLLTVFHLTGRPRLLLIWGLLLFCFIQTLVGAWQFQSGDGPMLLPWIARQDNLWRASGFYISPNHFAGLLEVMGVMALSLATWARLRPVPRILLGYLAVVCLVGVAISGSRGAYISTVFCLGIFTLLSTCVTGAVAPRRLRILVPAIVLTGIMMIGGGVLVMAKSPALQARLSTVLDVKNMRVYMWKSALEQHKLEPLVGTGSGTFLHYGRQFRDASVQNDPINVHNDYLELLAEYGIAGCVAFLLFLLAHVWHGLRNISWLAHHRVKGTVPLTNTALAVQIGALSGIAAFFAHSFVDFNVHIPANALLIAIIFALIASPGFERNEAGRPAVFLRRLLWFGTPALSAWMLFSAPPRIPGEFMSELARRSLRDDLLHSAIANAEFGLGTEKQNPSLFYYKGEALRRLAVEREDIEIAEKAAQSLNNAIRLWPQDRRSMLSLGRTLDYLLEFEEAEKVYKRAIAIDPLGNDVWAHYGMHKHQQGEWDDAKALYEKARSLGPNEYAIWGLRDMPAHRAQAENPAPLDEDDEELLPTAPRQPNLQQRREE